MLFSTIFATLMAGVALAQDYTINTPAALIQCQPANINWQGGQSPYILAVIPGGQPSAAALVTLADGTSDRSYVWTVSLAEGTSVTLRLTDAGGDIVYSSPVTIQAGSSTDCLNATATAAAGSAGVAAGGASLSAASGSASSGAATSAMSMSSSASGVGASVSSVSRAASSAASSAGGAVSSASSRVQSATGSSSGSATPVSSGAGAATSSPNAAMSNAAPAGVVLAALGGLLALF